MLELDKTTEFNSGLQIKALLHLIKKVSRWIKTEE